MDSKTLEQAKEQIVFEEGIKNSVYLCSESHKTVGIGHLCLKGEPEFEMDIGTKISPERTQELFNADFNQTLNDCKALFPEFDDYNAQIQIVLLNMCFQLGLPRLKGFKKMRKALDERNFVQMAKEMENSRWYRQTTNRAERQIARIESLIPIDVSS
tara:strand:+ start:416 stop:886 length:471 start_codon:yes stop_codon:yes gene_type:complete